MTQQIKPERDVTPEFLETVSSWIDASGEVFVVLRYLGAAGAKGYAFVRSRREFESIIDCVPDGTDVIAFRDPQLPVRGRVTKSFILEAMNQIPDGQEYLFVRMCSETKGDLRLDGQMGESHAELAKDLSEEMGETVALGACPPFIEGDHEGMISRSKGGIDGPR